jgi:hypothetical protein
VKLQKARLFFSGGFLLRRNNSFTRRGRVTLANRLPVFDKRRNTSGNFVRNIGSTQNFDGGAQSFN